MNLLRAILRQQTWHQKAHATQFCGCSFLQTLLSSKGLLIHEPNDDV